MIYLLYIDAKADRRQLLLSLLEADGYQVHSAGQVEEALPSALVNPPALVLLDFDIEEPLPLRRLRERYKIPLVLLGSPAGPEDEIVGLHRGADDVITTIDNPALVQARVMAALRHSGLCGDEADLVVVGDLVLDAAAQRVTVAGEVVELSTREFLLLWTLAREEGVVLTREELLDRVWGPHFVGEPQTLYVYISWLRKKLGAISDKDNQIVTVYGKGYKFET